jgi:hypothetical protein
MRIKQRRLRRITIALSTQLRSRNNRKFILSRFEKLLIFSLPFGFLIVAGSRCPRKNRPQAERKRRLLCMIKIIVRREGEGAEHKN